MKDKKLDVKKAMLQKLSQDLREGSKKSFGDELKSKKMQKVTVIAPDEKGLEKGLSKAQQLLKAKFGEMGLEEDEMEEMDGEESSEHECPMCSGKGCGECEEEEEELAE